jgi:putative spermidine/putrescine transport system permease protein
MTAKTMPQSVGGMSLSTAQSFLLLGGAALFMVLFFIGPLLLILHASVDPPSGGTAANYVKIATDGYYWGVLLHTFHLSLWVTLITFVLGYTLAYYLTFRVQSTLLRRLIYIAIVLPLFTSNIVRSFGWIVMLGRRGMVNEGLMSLGLTEQPLQLLYSTSSIVVSLAYVLLPFMILTITSVLQNINKSLIEASQDLGASPLVTFLKVTFPLSLPGVIAGSLIVFTLSVSAYVTPSIMSGGRQMVMPMLIYDYYMVQLDFSMGATLAILLLVATLTLIGAYLLLLKQPASAAA